ncbi:TorF family putative porin [Gallaecimonas kandeliae]|uniref:TorF family putative porin n=1 Tax=Gallaecimonas kandeliae TaxID=3029055 RepID=UPI0026474F1D|nr:TorF family putative porin [Gallaecimonas kandeliae]WKE66676.1 TorF family putative porin [Gallaecimonas kandeliae]
MKKTITAALLASSFAIGAQAADVSATLTGASDYLFNGYSQTSENPAIQGSLDAAFDNGFYVGTWASNVDFGPGDKAQAEWDFYGGYSADFADGWNYDIGINQYTYVGKSSYNYPEAYASITAPTHTKFKVWYTWEQAGIKKLHHSYMQLHQSYSLDDHWGLEAAYTYNKALSGPGSNDYWAGKDHYSNWLIGATASFGGFDFALNWQDTDIKGVPEADGRVYFSVSRSFDL